MRHKQQGVQRRGGRRGTPRRRSASSWAQGPGAGHRRGRVFARTLAVPRAEARIADRNALVARFPSPDAARRGHQGSLPQQTRTGRSAQCAARPDGCRTTLGASAPVCARLLRRCPGRLCAGVLLRRHEGSAHCTRTTSDRCAALSAAPGTSTRMMPCVPRSIIPSRSARKRRRPCDHRVALEPAAPCPTPQTREKVSP